MHPGAGARGIASFLVRADQPGVIRGQPYEMLGAHATGAGGFTFNDVELADDQLFNPSGDAYRLAMEAIGLARVVVAGLCVGLSRRSCGLRQGTPCVGGPLSTNQGLRWALADVATDIDAASGLTSRAAVATDNNDADAAIRVPHAKKFAARAATHGVERSMQALGANGLLQSQAWPATWQRRRRSLSGRNDRSSEPGHREGSVRLCSPRVVWVGPIVSVIDSGGDQEQHHSSCNPLIWKRLLLVLIDLVW